LSRADIGWLTGQVVVLGVMLVAMPLADGGPGRIQVPGSSVVGGAVVAAGIVWGIVAMRQLGRQLVPQPTPVAGGRLVDAGLYGIVRHPIYTAVLAICTGVVVAVPSGTGLVLLVATWVFFDRKSAYEEGLLRAAHPTYAAYQARVPWKFVPGIR
jgi:protein-S-isoprenylcysteine O-methyltransferase Ste14